MNIVINVFLTGMAMSGVLYAAVRYGLITGMEEKWEGSKMLYEMNKKTHKSWTKALVTTVRTITWVTYLMVYQKIYKNIITIGKNVYDVHYVYHGQLYKIRCRHEMGPKRVQVLMVMDHNSENVSKKIMCYLGPKGNFHNMRYTPSELGHVELHFFLSDGTVKIFGKDDEMVWEQKKNE